MIGFPWLYVYGQDWSDFEEDRMSLNAIEVERARRPGGEISLERRLPPQQRLRVEQVQVHFHLVAKAKMSARQNSGQ
ncbi:MAG: hypothetical protein R2688_01585 [Fimbriimonadaceae bacterium]